MTRYFGPRELAELADRLEARARGGRECRLSPDTALCCVRVLRAYAARPTRGQVIEAMRGVPGARADAYETIAAANGILQLFEAARPPLATPPVWP
jgi:hypothetical protein